MADIHNALRRGWLSRAVTLALGDTRGGGIERFGETLTPTMDIWSQPDWSVLRDELWLGAEGQTAAVVAQNNVARLRNPVGSGIIAVVRQWGCSTAAAAGMVRAGITLNQADLATLVAPTRLDPRTNTILGGTCIVSHTNNIGFAGTIYRSTRAANEAIREQIPVVLTPNVSFTFGQDDVNQLLNWYIIWTERKAQRGELV